MIEKYMIMSVILLFLAAKKKPVFGQMTLTGDLALDWVKQGEELVLKPRKIEFAPAEIYAEDYNVPEWHMDKGLVALIWPQSEWGNPVFVTQKSILKPLEAQCAAWEEKGATCSVVKYGKATIGRIEFDDAPPTIKIFKDQAAKQFAPYQVNFE